VYDTVYGTGCTTLIKDNYNKAQCKEPMSVSADIVDGYKMTYCNRNGKVPSYTINKDNAEKIMRLQFNISM